MIQSCTPTLINNTITQNYCTSSTAAARGGGLSYYGSGSYAGNNNIVYSNTATQNPEFYGTVNFTYSCCPTALTGTGNITSNPMFVNPTLDDFHLQAGSPCVDAGDPGSPLDPDGSRADMGALYYDHGGSYPNVQVTLTPVNPPIIIPAAGGQFTYNAQLQNLSGATQTVNAWIMQRLPNGTWQGPLLGPVSLVMPNGANVTRSRFQNVPGTAASGVYLYCGYVGTYNPMAKWDSSYFNYTKTATDGAGILVHDWACTGELFPGEQPQGSQTLPLPSDLALKAFPNPFNPETALSYQLTADSHVSIRVYGTSGREVATLVEGWREAGVQEVTFDASALPSGTYFARVTAGDAVQVQKLILVK
ncbi:MAG: T9SS C-terminal target domain-containing protein [Candidatus Zixiibacteriota bacterium]|nr:MAG: T9SS C-terminal target domain-containing protein [candidate division Zixibacteria bacterium]